MFYACLKSNINVIMFSCFVGVHYYIFASATYLKSGNCQVFSSRPESWLCPKAGTKIFVMSSMCNHRFMSLVVLIFIIIEILWCGWCRFNGCIDGIVQRLKTYKDPTLVHEIKVKLVHVVLWLCSKLCWACSCTE